MDHTHDCTRPAPVSRLRARLLCAAACVALIAPEAYARNVTTRLPSVEVHLEVLKDLTSGATSFSAPVPGRNSISSTYLPPPGQSAPVDSQPTTASGRKIPSEQPDTGQYGALTRKPVNAPTVGAPFGRASAPLPKSYAAKPKPKPVSKAVAKAKEQTKEVAKDISVKPAIADTAKVEAPKAEVKAQDEKKLMEALEKETAVVPAPAPLPEPQVPTLTPAPDIQLPAAPAIPDFKPDLALPAPVPELPAPTAELPKIPAPAPETLVMEKHGGPALPPIPNLPAPGEPMPAPNAELMPSLSKRMDTLFAKQPDKQGIVEDSTTIEGLSPDAQKNAEETAKRLEEQQKQIAKDQEAARAEQLRQQEELKKLSDRPLENNMPVPKDVPKLESSEIAALPPITLPGAIPAASEVDLPPPALPPLTPITGEGGEKSSLDIVQPEDGIASVDNTPPAMQPLNAPEALPKVTKGDSEAEALPALPPIELPKPEATAKKENLPPIPDFSAMSVPKADEAPQETKVAIAEQPKPDFVTAEEVKAAEPAPAPVAEGTIAGSLVFDKDKTDLGEDAKARLSKMAEGIIANGQNVRIVSYAAGTADQASIARRISLSRALQIRAFLISKGVNQLKINVQAQGNKEQAERADIYLK